MRDTLTIMSHGSESDIALIHTWLQLPRVKPAMGTCILGHWDWPTWALAHMSTGAHGHRHTWTQGQAHKVHRHAGAQVHRGTGIQRHKHTRAQAHKVTGTHDCTDTRNTGTQQPNDNNAWTQGYKSHI